MAYNLNKYQQFGHFVHHHRPHHLRHRRDQFVPEVLLENPDDQKKLKRKRKRIVSSFCFSFKDKQNTLVDGTRDGLNAEISGLTSVVLDGIIIGRCKRIIGGDGAGGRRP